MINLKASEDCEYILLELGLQYTILCFILYKFFKHLFMFNVHCHALMYSTNNCCYKL